METQEKVLLIDQEITTETDEMNPSFHLQGPEDPEDEDEQDDMDDFPAKEDLDDYDLNVDEEDDLSLNIDDDDDDLN